MLELEHKEKNLFTEYLTELGQDSTVIIKENPLTYTISDNLQKMDQNTSANSEREEKIYTELIQLCKDKQKYYKQKYANTKAKSLYSALDNKNLIQINTINTYTSAYNNNQKKEDVKKSVDMGNYLTNSTFEKNESTNMFKPLGLKEKQERNRYNNLQDYNQEANLHSVDLNEVIPFVNENNKNLINHIHKDLSTIHGFLDNELFDIFSERVMIPY